MLHREPKPRRRPIVEDINGIARKSQRVDETSDDFGKLIETIGKCRAARCDCVAEPQQIGRNHPIAVGELRNEIAKHVPRRRKAVQQKKDGRIGLARFTVEYFHLADLYRPVGDDCVHRFAFR